MIKKIILAFLTLSIFLVCPAFSAESSQFSEKNDSRLLGKLSPISESLYLDLSSGSLDSTDYMICYINSIPYIGSLCIANSTLDDSFINEYDILKGATVKNYYSVKVPLANFKKFCNAPEIKYIQADEPVTLHLDSANASSNFVNAGVDFTNSQFYESSGVVVGVIDFGFQFNHLMFQNSSGSTRVRRAWVQSQQSNSAPPNFRYGSELTPLDFISIPTDSQVDSHGSHVLGIAAGARFPGTNIQGVASEADIILVSPNVYWDQLQTTSQTDIVDGIDYIFKEASRLGKPCVINLSLGTQIGPHDGNSIFDIMAAELQNSAPFGRSLVTSAGNDGFYDMTITKDFSVNGEPVSSFFALNASDNQFIDIWGEEGSEICISLGIIDGNSTKWTEERFCNDKSGVFDGILSTTSAAYSYRISASPSELINGKSRLFLTLDLLSEPTIGAIRIESDGLVYAWNCFMGGSRGDDFLSRGSSNYVDGVRGYQIGEIGGNNEDFITVASHNTRLSYTNIYGYSPSIPGQSGNISTFSSLGPNADMKRKPDISAPGSIILSAYNFFDNTSKINPLGDQEEQRSRSNYAFIDSGTGDIVGQLSGTSMSSPVVAGTIALMLRANPYLIQDEIKSILKETAKEDSFTGVIPSSGSDIWGAGKLDTYEAVRKAEERATSIDLFPEVEVWPNPFNENVNVSFANTPTVKRRYQLVDNLGRIYEEGEIQFEDESEENFKVQINGGNLPEGIYYLKIDTDRFQKGILLVKLTD